MPRNWLVVMLVMTVGCAFGGEPSGPEAPAGAEPRIAEPAAPLVDLSRAARHTYYVAPDGADRHSGSKARPFATIQRALRRARAGDRIIVRPGEYRPARFVRSGRAHAPIRLEARGKVVLRGDGGGDGLAVQGRHHVLISGFTITNFSVGISLANASDVVVRGNTLRSNTSTGILNWEVRRVSIVGNRLMDPGPPYPQQGNAMQDYGVNAYYSESVSVKNNYFFGKHNQALSFKRRTVTSSATGNVFNGCMYTCIYVGQNDDDGEGDMTSNRIAIRHNRFRPARDPRTGVRYRVSIPIRVRNVRHAVVEENVIHPACLDRVDVESSPQLAGLQAGDNTIRRNVVRRW